LQPRGCAPEPAGGAYLDSRHLPAFEGREGKEREEREKEGMEGKVGRGV